MSKTSQRLIIVGGGEFSREVLAWLDHLRKVDRDLPAVGGYLDARKDALEKQRPDVPWLGTPDDYVPLPGDVLACAIAAPAAKLRVCRDLRDRGGRFMTVIHPTAVVGTDSTIGEGAVLCPGVVITSNATIGEFVTLNVHATVGHDATIGAGSTLSGHCDVTGKASIGEGVFMGSHATVLPGAVVGAGAMVGAGSVVLRRVAPGASVMGVPARTIHVPGSSVK